MFLLWFLFCFLNKQQGLECLFVLGIIFVCDTIIKLQNSAQYILMVMHIVLNHFILTGNNTCGGGCESIATLERTNQLNVTKRHQNVFQDLSGAASQPCSPIFLCALYYWWMVPISSTLQHTLVCTLWFEYTLFCQFFRVTRHIVRKCMKNW